MRHALAGFPSSENGAWTFCEIAVGDFVSFLYGAKAYNLYTVVRREAIRNADTLPPWKPIRFADSKRAYCFPFRLWLRSTRVFTESLVRAEFSYVAENLLLRGGYRKTHFQADQTTLQSVSEMGTPASTQPQPVALPPYDTFTLRFTRARDAVKSPEVCRFRETILQSAIRKHLSRPDDLQRFFTSIGVENSAPASIEVLSEKALPQGHIDLLLKRRVPLGSSPKVPIEVKTSRADLEDLSQLRRYMAELSQDCPFGVLIASDFRKTLLCQVRDPRVHLIRYSLDLDLRTPQSFEQMVAALRLHVV